jgi:hypothetical protein
MIPGRVPRRDVAPARTFRARCDALVDLMDDPTHFDWAMNRAAKLYPSIPWQLEYRHDGVMLTVDGWDWSGIALAGVSLSADGARTLVVDANTREDKGAWLDEMLGAVVHRRQSYHTQPQSKASRGVIRGGLKSGS